MYVLNSVIRSLKCSMLGSTFSSTGSESSKTGSEWTSTLSFVDHYNNTSCSEMKEGELLDYFANLGTKKEEILAVQIFQYGLFAVIGKIGFWHEYVIIKSTNYFWSFEKHETGLYVRRSNKENDVKKRFSEGNEREIKEEARGPKLVKYKDTIYDTIQWIVEKKELDNKYHIKNANCQIFASLLYESIARLKNRKLRESETN